MSDFERSVSEDKNMAPPISSLSSVCIAPLWTTYASLSLRAANTLMRIYLKSSNAVMFLKVISEACFINDIHRQ